MALKFVADVPTITMSRLKALLTVGQGMKVDKSVHE